MKNEEIWNIIVSENVWEVSYGLIIQRKMIENIKMGRYFQSFESLKAKLEEKDTYSLYTEWWSTKTKEESEVLDKAYDYEEEYFSDLRLIETTRMSCLL